MMNSYLALTIGLLCAGLGGEFFIRGTVQLASWARVSTGIIGVTVAAFATSSPELSVAIGAALAGIPNLSFGDALGSNVVNVGLILGFTLSISAIEAPPDIIRRDFPIALLAPVLVGGLILDGRLSRLDGLVLLAVFSVWVLAVTWEALRQRSVADERPEGQQGWSGIFFTIAGLTLLIGGSRLIVIGARGIASFFGIDDFIIGTTVVAVGTSVPEIATVTISKIRGHDEVGMGTILGSNIYNGLFIIAVAAVIHPITIDRHEAALALAFGLLTVVLTVPDRSGRIGRRRGPLLLGLYLTYVIAVINL